MVTKAELAQINVLGFDLGHGKTALTFVSGCDEKTPPEDVLLYGVPYETTAITYLDEKSDPKEVIWGENAIIFASQNGKAADSFDIGFKYKPGFDKNRDEKIRDFARVVYQDAVSVQFGNPRILEANRLECYIGCPTAWNEEVKESYRKLFIDAGLPNPKIIAESEAAFAYYYEKVKNKEEEQVTIGESHNPILLLDFGSSTLDATIVTGRKSEPLGDGLPLGASLIDKAILEWNLQHYADEDYPGFRTIRQRSEERYQSFLSDLTDLKQRLYEKAPAYAMAELFCRKKKVEFFEKARAYKSEETPLIRSVNIVGYDLPICIWQDLMDDLLNTPLENLIPNFHNFDHDVYQELAGYSWLGRLRKFLEDLNVVLGKNDLQLGRVIVTGGASLMPQVREMTKHYFPNCKFTPDNEAPMLCIARGLACRGLIDVQTQAFEKEINAFCDDADNGLFAIVAKHYCGPLNETSIPVDSTVGRLYRRLGEKAASIVKSKFDDWLNKVIDANKIGYWIKKEMEEWSDSEELRDIISEEMSRMEKAVRQEINTDLKELCAKYALDNIVFLAEPFLHSNLLEIFRETSGESDSQNDQLSNDSLSFVSALEELVKNIAEQFNKLEDDQFSGLGNGPRWWRRIGSVNGIEKFCIELQNAIQQEIASFLTDKDALITLLATVHELLKRTMHKEIVAAKYLLANW